MMPVTTPAPSGETGSLQTTFGDEALEQLFVRGQLMARQASGAIRLVELPVGVGPGRDAKVAQNQAALERGLSAHGLQAEVNCAKGSTDDGRVSWRESFTFHPTHVDPAVAARPQVELPPGSIPLEIGYTLPSRTWSHLRVSGAVCRWPYGSTSVWLIVDPNFGFYGVPDNHAEGEPADSGVWLGPADTR